MKYHKDQLTKVQQHKILCHTYFWAMLISRVLAVIGKLIKITDPFAIIPPYLIFSIR